jgi:hypothetical protein
MRRVADAAYWAAPSLLCLAIYWLGLRAWFQQDDFAWLTLHQRLRESGDLWGILFSPRAQGTIRPLSERGFFLLFHGWFGLNALPFRIVAFATQFINLVLVGAIARKLTRSRTAGFLAAVLWVANGALATVMSWTSAYNQLLCAFFVLASFWFFLLHIETGKRRYYALQWVSFLLGFGALEIIVVYPAIAASYAFLAARKHFRKTLWLFPPSALYVFVHWHYAPAPAAGPYMMHWDAGILATLWTYWQWTLGPARLDLASIVLPGWIVLAATLALTLALLGFASYQLRRQNWAVAFPLLWFLILLAPVLPLRDHLSDYYLTMPAIGMAILGAWATVAAWRSRWYARTAAVLLAAIYVASSLPVARAVTRWNYRLARESRGLVQGLVRARQLHPGKLILLTDVPSDLFWGTVYHKAYLVAGVQDVYLAPGSEESIQPHPELDAVSNYVLPSAVALRALDEDRAVVYSDEGDRLRNVTQVVRATARARWGEPKLPSRIDAGSPLFADQLGQSWYPVEGTYRWMPKRATAFLRGPTAPGEQLHLSGFCPVQLVKTKPLILTASVDGVVVGQAQISKAGAPFDLAFPMPVPSVGKAKVEVTLEVDRTFVVPSDGRTLGLVFGTIAVR